MTTFLLHIKVINVLANILFKSKKIHQVMPQAQKNVDAHELFGVWVRLGIVFVCLPFWHCVQV
jgi:hypothetical protein